MILGERSQDQFDVENEQWCKEQRNNLKVILNEILKKYSSKTVGELRIKKIETRLRKQYHHLSFFISIISKNMPICECTWNPVLRELEWIHIVVSNPGKGIATQMRNMMEELAASLQARKLICNYIAERHYDYWRKLRSEGYDLNDVTGYAVKKISS